MLRNQFERHDGPEGRWAEINGAQDIWILTWSGARGPLDYRKIEAARDAALAWVERGKDPRSAQTLVLPAAPAGAFR